MALMKKKITNEVKQAKLFYLKERVGKCTQIAINPEKILCMKIKSYIQKEATRNKEIHERLTEAAKNGVKNISQIVGKIERRKSIFYKFAEHEQLITRSRSRKFSD
jgi:hypothetical protein